MRRNLIAKYVLFIFIYLCSFFVININAYAEDNCIQKINLGDKIEKHWWGYRRYVSDEQITKFSSKLDSIAAEFSFFGRLSVPISFFNPLAGILVNGILELSSSYCWLLSTYIIKINKGNGVTIDFNKGIVFKIKAI